MLLRCVAVPDPHHACTLYPQAKKAAKKQQLLQRMSSGEPGPGLESAPLLNGHGQQNGHSRGSAHNSLDVPGGKADQQALQRAAEKLGGAK